MIVDLDITTQRIFDLLSSTRGLVGQLEEVPSYVEVVEPERREPKVVLQVEVWTDRAQIADMDTDLGRKT